MIKPYQTSTAFFPVFPRPKTSRDQRGPRVGAEAEAVGGAAGDGQDVLQRATELRPDDVRGGVDAEVPRGQGHLDLLGHLQGRWDGDTRIYIYIYTYICMYVYVYIYMCIYIYVYIYISFMYILYIYMLCK